MEPINGVGSQNYAVAPQMPQDNSVQDFGTYQTMPEVYQPEVEVKKKASSNMLGMTILGLSTAAVGGLIGKKFGSKGLQEAQTAASEAKKLYEAANKEKAEIKTALDKERTMGLFQRIKRVFNSNSGLSKTEIEAKEAAMKAKEEAKKAEKAVKKGADKANEKGAEKAGEAVTNSADDAAAAADSMIH